MDHCASTRKAKEFFALAEDVSERTQLLENTVFKMDEAEEKRRTERPER